MFLNWIVFRIVFSVNCLRQHAQWTFPLIYSMTMKMLSREFSISSLAIWDHRHNCSHLFYKSFNRKKLKEWGLSYCFQYCIYQRINRCRWVCDQAMWWLWFEVFFFYKHFSNHLVRLQHEYDAHIRACSADSIIPTRRKSELRDYY